MTMLNSFPLIDSIEYVYLGDRSTAQLYKGQKCKAVFRADGKCIRGKNGNMLVSFREVQVVVQARLLRKIKKANQS
jgi:hypothetical protein